MIKILSIITVVGCTLVRICANLLGYDGRINV